MHVTVRHASRRVERRQQTVGEVEGEGEETGVAIHLVGGDQPTQQAYRHLEDLNGKVVIERQPLEDQRLGFRRLVLQAHQQHRVERVQRRHQEGRLVPVAGALAERGQLVVAPGVTLVPVPGVKESLADTFGVILSVSGLGRAAREESEQNDERCESAGDERLSGDCDHIGLPIVYGVRPATATI